MVLWTKEQTFAPFILKRKLFRILFSSKLCNKCPSKREWWKKQKVFTVKLIKGHKRRQRRWEWNKKKRIIWALWIEKIHGNEQSETYYNIHCSIDSKWLQTQLNARKKMARNLFALLFTRCSHRIQHFECKTSPWKKSSWTEMYANKSNSISNIQVYSSGKNSNSVTMAMNWSDLQIKCIEKSEARSPREKEKERSGSTSFESV